MTDNIWGFLAPAYGLEQRIDLTYAHTWYKIGSDARLRPRTNTITLPEARKCGKDPYALMSLHVSMKLTIQTGHICLYIGQRKEIPRSLLNRAVTTILM